MHTAHEESKKKSQRLGKAWQEKKRQAASGKPLTAVCPAWISLDRAKGQFKLIPEKVKVVRRIFEEASRGTGHHTIAKLFNEEGVPGIGRTGAWHGSYIQKILNNEAVIGRYQPHKLDHSTGKRRRIVDGESIENYYPAAISTALYFKVHDMRTSRRQTPSGPRSKRDGSPSTNGNLFTGLLKCAACDESMNFVNKGQGGYYLVCSNARRGLGCTYSSWNYTDFEEFVLHYLSDRIDWVSLLPTIQAGTQTLIDELEEVQASVRALLEDCDTRLDNLMSAIETHGFSETLSKRLKETEEKKKLYEKQQKETMERLENERRRLASSEVISVAFDDWTSKHSVSRFREDMKPAQATERQKARSQLAHVLRERISKIVLDSEAREIFIDFRDEALPGLSIPFGGLETLAKEKDS